MMRIFVLAGLLITAFITLTGCGKEAEDATPDEVAIPVEVTTATQKVIPRTLEFAGSILAWREANLGAQMAGRIEKIYVQEGDEVKAGDVLVQMDDTQLTQARVAYQIAKDDDERMEPLFRDGSISPQQFDKVKAAYETAKATYELMLRNTQLRAPFSATVTAKRMNEGEVFVLMPGGGGVPPSIISLMQIDPLKVLVNATESDFPRIRLGMPAEISVDIYPARPFEGRVSRIDPAINRDSRTFAVEIRVANPNKVLRPGMFARVKIIVGEENALVVPRAALIRQPGSSIMYGFVVENGGARRREVRLGVPLDDLVEIKEGLQAGDQIVIKGQLRLKDGSPVTLSAISRSQGK